MTGGNDGIGRNGNGGSVGSDAPAPTGGVRFRRTLLNVITIQLITLLLLWLLQIRYTG